MRNMKKIVSIIIGIIVIIATLGAYNTSNAYSVGDEINISASEYYSNSDIYCMQHGQKLRGSSIPYKVVSRVIIEGNKSTDYEGKEMTNKANAKFAAILSASNGTGKKRYGQVANAVWAYGSTWMKEVGQYHKGLTSGFATYNGYNVYPTELMNQANQYADSITNEKEVKDNTDKDNIKVVAMDLDGTLTQHKQLLDDTNRAVLDKLSQKY